MMFYIKHDGNQYQISRRANHPDKIALCHPGSYDVIKEINNPDNALIIAIQKEDERAEREAIWL